MIWVAYVLVGFYSILILVLIFYWRKLSTIPQGESAVFVSIIIPVRNEATNIKETLLSVFESEYDIGSYEVLVINDHSEDNTVSIVKSIEHPNIQLLNLPVGENGKKSAITYAINKAKGELILCTDGDTQVGGHWVSCHANAYARGAKISFGAVKYSPSKYFRYLNIELSGLVTVGAVTAHLGHPSMINGCNYSFDKKTFHKVDGFQGNLELPSGDDEFLLRKIHAVYPDSVTFLKGINAAVSTKAPNSFREFYNQRRRWASKWKSHKGLTAKIMPVAVFGFYLSMMGLYFDAVFFGSVVSFLAIVIKSIADFLLMKKGGMITFGIRDVVPFFLIQIIYPFYAVFFGLASNFGRYSWRGRVYRI